MPVRFVAVSFDARNPSRLATFWAGLLDRPPVEEAGEVLLPGGETQVGLRFVPATAPESRPSWLHLHLTSTSLDDQRRTVEESLERGGRHLDVGQLPEEGHVVLADPEGNAFCVIEPASRFLAGCGRLGEVACDGTRDVGVYWRDALGWPLVWDRDEETAVQSPYGGTKIAWGGRPPASTDQPNRQRFELAARDLEAEVQRLIALGARELGRTGDRVELADPDGTEFWMRPDGSGSSRAEGTTVGEGQRASIARPR